MRFTLQNPESGEIVHVNLPAKERELQRISDAISIPNDMRSKVAVTDCENPTLTHLLQREQHNLTELNFFVSLQDRLADSEKKAVYVVAKAQNLTTTKDLINLSFNAEEYELVSDFAVAAQRTGEHPQICEHGFVFGADKEIPEHYNGKTFPLYPNGSLVSLSISAGGNTDYLRLPTEESDYQKVLERIGAEHSWDAQMSVEACALPKSLAEIAMKNLPNLEKLNEQIEKLSVVGHGEFSYLDSLARNIGITEPEELSTLIKAMHEFEFYPNIRNSMDYGTYMICESGHFEYDENLEEYVDFEGYGRDKIARESGSFTQDGYLLYQGYNQEMQSILTDNLGMVFDSLAAMLDLSLYMPLTVTSWYEEDGWGNFEECGCEETLGSYECRGNVDEMSEFLQKYQEDLPLERGLMEYYGEKDAVNAKVKSLRFDIESIHGELYGVAKCELHAPLNPQELQKLKDFTTGQAADGLGEGFEQQDFKMDDRPVNIHLWNRSDSWSIKTEQEMGLGGQNQGLSMSMS